MRHRMMSSILDTLPSTPEVRHVVPRRFPTRAGRLDPCVSTATVMKNSVRELRTAQGWSQADLGEKLDVSRQTVNAIETGKYDPSLPLAFKIAMLFALPIESIFTPAA